MVNKGVNKGDIGIVGIGNLVNKGDMGIVRIGDMVYNK